MVVEVTCQDAEPVEPLVADIAAEPIAALVYVLVLLQALLLGTAPSSSTI